MNKLIETSKYINEILESGIEIHPNSPVHEKLKQALNIACVRKSAYVSFNWWQWILFCIGYSIFNQWIVSMFA
jgi:hypothetical protein